MDSSWFKKKIKKKNSQGFNLPMVNEGVNHAEEHSEMHGSDISYCKLINLFMSTISTSGPEGVQIYLHAC